MWSCHSEVVVEVGRLGERVLDGRQLRDLGGARAAVLAVVEVVLEELLDVDLLQRVVALGSSLRLLLRDLVGGRAPPGGTSSSSGFSITSCSSTSASSSVVRGSSLIACWSDGVRISLCERRV